MCILRFYVLLCVSMCLSLCGNNINIRFYAALEADSITNDDNSNELVLAT